MHRQRTLTIQIVSTYYAPETTGNAPYVTSLARGLAALGHSVSVIAGAPHYPGWRILPPEQWAADEVTDGVHVQRVTSFVPAKPTFLTRIVYELGFGLRFAARVSRNADVVLLVSPSLFASLVVRGRLALSSRRPAVALWVQDLYSAGVAETPGAAARLLSSAMAAVEGVLLRSVSSVAVIHDRFGDFASRRLRVAPDNILVIRNWTHVVPTNAVDRSAVRERMGWTRPGEVIVVHAGNMGAKQGLENVVDAARHAEERRLPVRFVLLGDGNQRAALKARARGCDRVDFIDPLPGDAFMEVLAAADVLLVNERPSLREAALPSKLTTYFATGRPVLAATDATSTTADEIRASGAGRVVPPADPEALTIGALTIAHGWTEADSQAGPAHVDRVLSERAGVARFESLLMEAVIGSRDSADLERVK